MKIYKKKQKNKILSWVLFGWLIICALLYQPYSIANFLWGIATILAMPTFNFFSNKKPIKILLILALFFGGAAILPSSESTLNNTTLSSENKDAYSEDSTTSSNHEDTNKDGAIHEDSYFKITFLDVGQADAALIECDDQYMLIDGGNQADSNLIYTVLKNKNITHLNLLVASHAHEDHIGGISGALTYANADVVLCPTLSFDSKAFSNFKKNANANGGGIIIPSVGDTYYLGNASIQILGINSTDDTNNSSIVLKITYGNTSFLFTGDAEREAEQVILNSGYDLSSDVIKVGHHGSETSSTYPFIREVMPKYAVISVGKGNSYGHPHDNTLSRYKDADTKIYRTDLQGDIVCTSDGTNITFSTDKNVSEEQLLVAGKLSSSSNTNNTSNASKNDSSITSSNKNNTTSSANTSQSSSSSTNKNDSNENIISNDTMSSTTDNYILNTNTKKFHTSDCRYVNSIKDKNKAYHTGSKEELINQGYDLCKVCNP